MARRSRTKNVVGLDIEPGAITAARVTVNGHIAVEQAAAAVLEPNIVRDGEVADVEALAAALRSLWSENKGLGRTVRVGVANARIVMRIMDLPPVDNAKDLASIVRFQAEQHLPMPLDSAVLDYQVVGTVETPDGPRTRAVVVAARRDMIERLATAVSAAGLRLEGIDLSAFAMIRALRRDDEPVLYLSVGGLTNLAVADERGCSFTRVTGGGLEAMVLALAERLQVPADTAREWIFSAGFDGTDTELEDDLESLATMRTVLTAGVRQIANEVRSSLDFHHAQAEGDANVASVVLTGQAASVPGFAERLCTELGLPVEARGVKGISDVREGVDPSRLSVAAGLAVAEVVPS
jgi:type IV pilus assembly protein PilM